MNFFTICPARDGGGRGRRSCGYDPVRSGWLTTGPKVARFEKDFAEYVGAKYALPPGVCRFGYGLAGRHLV